MVLLDGETPIGAVQVVLNGPVQACHGCDTRASRDNGPRSGEGERCHYPRAEVASKHCNTGGPTEGIQLITQPIRLGAFEVESANSPRTADRIARKRCGSVRE
ncbi:hypothetical protein MNBD_ACTINO02-2918 [hydrothermal vent metagenome]|uniref:Uncharacterized protein n=1 Tax=hydrothermal vent metagenome TaxID=652676 RepID=A0A3B0SQ95_9ZZZZ